MKHLVVGLIVGAISAVVLFVLYLAWTAISSMVGSIGGAAAVMVFVFVVVGAALIDWKTEKKEE